MSTSRQNSRESSSHSLSSILKEVETKERRRIRKNSICDSNDDDDDGDDVDIDDDDDDVDDVEVDIDIEADRNAHLNLHRDRDRDLSPSTQSHHSSGTGVALEWDPSADVGAQVQVPANTPVHQSQILHPSSSLDGAGGSGELSSLDQVVLALNYPYVAESRSRRFDLVSQRSNSNLSNHSNHSNNSNSNSTSSRSHRQTGSPTHRNSQGSSSSKGSTSEASHNSNSSYKTATETETDPAQMQDRDPSPKVPDAPTSSWQTSGLTRSEIKYMSRKSSSSTRSHTSSSLLWVEVVPVEGGNDSSVTKPQDTTTASEINQDTSSASLPKINVGIQTKTGATDPPCHCQHQRQRQNQNQNQNQRQQDKPILNEQKSKVKTKGTQVQVSDTNRLQRNSNSNSNSNSNFNDIMESDENGSDINGNRLRSGFGSSYSISAAAAVSAASAVNSNYTDRNQIRNRNQNQHQNHLRNRGHHYSNDNSGSSGTMESHRHVGSVIGPGSGRSLNSQPSGSRSSGDYMAGRGNHSSEEGSGGSGNSNFDLHSSDNLTPTCALLDKIFSEGNPNMKNYGFDVLEHHRNTLVYKMRKEFQHLERLNKILMEKRQGQGGRHQPGGSRTGTGTGTGTGTRRMVASSLKETSISISDGSNRDVEIEVKTSKKAALRQDSNSTSTSSGSSRTLPSSNASKGDHLNVHIKQSRRPYDYATDKHHSKGTQVQETTKHSKLTQVCQVKKPVSYYLPFAPGPPGSSNFSAIPKPKTEPSRSNSMSNGDEKENRRPGGRDQVQDQGRGGSRSREQSQKQVQKGRQGQDGQVEEVDLHGGVGGGFVLFENELVQISLQQAFEQCCPSVLSKVQQREYLLSQLKQEREFKTLVKRNYFKERENCLSPNDSLNKALPAKETRLMSTKEMRSLTERKIKALPEVKEKVVRRRLEEDKKTNRILSQVFSRKLRQHVLKGDMNIVHSKCLIRH